MLNIGKLGRGQEDYYLEAVADSGEDYYLGSGEAPGYWLGSALKVSGTVSGDALKHTLSGHDPCDGTPLRQRNSKQRVPGFDLTFRAPKSVSLVHALGGRELSREIRESHDAAVKEALGYLERSACATRRRNRDGDIEQHKGSGFIAAAFRHRTSRAGDPLLHTHVLIANLTQTSDGFWGALDARQIYAHAKTAGYLYQAHLRMELTQRTGVAWSEVHRGTADIEGVPRAVIRAFSKRRAEIEGRMQDRGEAGATAAQVAALDTRHAKDYNVTPDKLLPTWREKAEKLGLTEKVVHSLLNQSQYQEVTYSNSRRLVDELVGPSGLTESASSFNRRDLLRSLAERIGLASVKQLESFADRLLSSDRVIPLAVSDNRLDGGDIIRRADGRIIAAAKEEARYSTAEMLETERKVIDRALSRRDAGIGIAPKQVVERALSRRSSLTPEQRRMVRALTSSGHGVDVVVGRAGTGKTFALDAAREAWQTSGHRVIGCSLAARAARELETGAGIESYTIDALLYDLDDPRSAGLSPATVLVVDEAAMVGTRKLARLLDHAAIADTKVVLVGDDRQLPEIAAGGAFRGLKNRAGAIELVEVKRQSAGWERDALEHLRHGRGSEAVAEYQREGRVTVAETAEETRAVMISDWWKAQAEGLDTILVAARRDDVADLNARARALLREAGEVKEDLIRIGERTFALGDRVMALRNRKGLGLINGMRGRITAIDTKRLEVTMRSDDGAEITLPRSYLEAGHITHAYAVTGHKSQGMTVDAAFVLGDETMYREWGYVAMSRGRQENRLYVVTPLDIAREEAGGAAQEKQDPIEHISRALSRSQAKQMAIEESRLAGIRSSDTASLWSRKDEIEVLFSGRPGDPQQEVARLSSERERLNKLVAQEKKKQLEAQTALKQMSALQKTRRRDEVRRLDERVGRARSAAGKLTESVEVIDAQLSQLTQHARELDSWYAANAAQLSEYREIVSELRRREISKVVALRSATPRYIIDLLGQEPSLPAERSRWESAVASIESFRERWRIKDQGRALGPEPKTAVQREEREAIERTLQQSQDQSADISLERRTS